MFYFIQFHHKAILSFKVLQHLFPRYIRYVLWSLCLSEMYITLHRWMFTFAQVSMTSNSWSGNGAESGAVSLVKDKA